MKLKSYKKKNIYNYLSIEVIILIISITSAIIIINYFSKEFNNTISPIAESKTKKYLTEIINNSTKNITYTNNLFTVEKNNDNTINMINYNWKETNKLINLITNNIETNIKKLEDSKNSITVSTIPLGVIFKNSIIRNFGAKIKIKTEIIGNVISELQTEVKPYGINNALVEVRVKVETNARVVLPFTSSEIIVTNIIPISINIVNGSVPEAYISTFK